MHCFRFAPAAPRLVSKLALEDIGNYSLSSACAHWPLLLGLLFAEGVMPKVKLAATRVGNFRVFMDSRVLFSFLSAVVGRCY